MQFLFLIFKCPEEKNRHALCSAKHSNNFFLHLLTCLQCRAKKKKDRQVLLCTCYYCLLFVRIVHCYDNNILTKIFLSRRVSHMVYELREDIDFTYGSAGLCCCTMSFGLLVFARCYAPPSTLQR